MGEAQFSPEVEKACQRKQLWATIVRHKRGQRVSKRGLRAPESSEMWSSLPPQLHFGRSFASKEGCS